MKRFLDFFWPLLGIVAVLLSARELYEKLRAEAAADPATRAALAASDFLTGLGVIVSGIGAKMAAIPASSYGFAFASTLVAYAALAWYDRIALIHLRKHTGISFVYVATCSFVTYALSHNIGASVFSGGMVRLRAYSAKGLTTAEVAVLVALCSFTFAFGTILLMGLVLLYEPQILTPLSALSRHFSVTADMARITGASMVMFCMLYIVGSLLHLRPLKIGEFRIVYPRMPIVLRQLLAAPIEIMGAAGIIYFALPWDSNPGFPVVLGGFVLSFSAGLLSQVPGGVGVMEVVFQAIMPQVPTGAVIAALLVWRVLYLLTPLGMAIPVIILFERSQLGKATRGLKPPPGSH